MAKCVATLAALGKYRLVPVKRIKAATAASVVVKAAAIETSSRPERIKIEMRPRPYSKEK